ncbi:MAG: P-loop NTPase [Eubacteriales bacterium]|nr:P-loop NTPase [Eubacteriales bacterium]
MGAKRITVLAGHYGSGKTNIAVNYAMALSENGKKVSIADLDIVNPYFRAKDTADILADMGIRMISSEYANSNVDTPAIPAEAYSIFADKSVYAVVDVGGDDRGALALGRYAPYLLEENNFEMLFVINKYRFLTADAQSTIEVMREIEGASGVRFTGIVNNSNLGEETTYDEVLASLDYAKEVSELTGLPIKMTTVRRELYGELNNEIKNLQPIGLYVRQSWLKQQEV